MSSLRIYPLDRPVEGTVKIPGSKSLTNRALVIASLTGGKSEILGASESNDSKALISALLRLGVKIERGKDKMVVYGNKGRFKEFKGKINIGPAGTAMRFLTSFCCLVPGKIVLDGSERMRQRPIGDLVNALVSLGANIEYLGKKGCPPLSIRGGELKGGEVTINGSVSSQYFTSLMMIAPLLSGGLKIKVAGNQVSKSYIDMTIGVLKSFGVEVNNDCYGSYMIEKTRTYKPTNYRVEGDASGASYFFAIAAINKSKIRVENIYPDSWQGDTRFPDLLEKMGCKIVKNLNEKWIEVMGSENLRAISINMELMPDTAQTLAVVAVFAKGKTKITGLPTLCLKETNRIQAMHEQLKMVGIQSEVGDDYIVIEGGKPCGAKIKTYKDHRMAMSFAVLGTKVPGIDILNSEVVDKSFPEFWEKLAGLGIKLEQL